MPWGEALENVANPIEFLSPLDGEFIEHLNL